MSNPPPPPPPVPLSPHFPLRKSLQLIPPPLMGNITILHARHRNDHTEEEIIAALGMAAGEYDKAEEILWGVRKSGMRFEEGPSNRAELGELKMKVRQLEENLMDMQLEKVGSGFGSDPRRMQGPVVGRERRASSLMGPSAGRI